MSAPKYLLSFFFAIAFFPVMLFSDFTDQDGSAFDEELNESDFRALQNFVKTKREIPLEKKTTKMFIAGDVRAEWRHMSESGRKGPIDGKQENLRGGTALDYADFPVSKNDFDAEFNLYFEYKTERTWAVAQLQFDNSCGVFDNNKKCPGHNKNSAQGTEDILSNGKDTADPEGWHGSGKCDKICLKKAYFGYNLCQEGDRRLDVEIGRRRLSNVFESDIEFLSQFDGVTFKMSDKWDIASSYLNAAAFVVNERINHFGYVFEVGLLDIKECGLDVKYSFIDWRKNGRAQCSKLKEKDKNGQEIGENEKGHLVWIHNPKAFKFLISQLYAEYHFNPDYFCGKPASLYGAFLINHNTPVYKYVYKEEKENDKKKRFTRRARHVNTGWYVGFLMGEVKKENDWSLDIEYQYVGAVAVPDGDCRGICRGNILDESLTSIGRGNTNFKGWRVEFLYAITDNLSLDSILEYSRAANPKIGGHHTFSKFELETIYAF